MARLLLRHGRRHCIPTSSTPSLSLLRPFCSSFPIKPVSYAVKPKDPESPPPPTPPPPPPNPNAAARSDSQPFEAAPGVTPPYPPPRQWTRADARFVKDVPTISPVSYPSKVAPLPEDKPKPEGGEEEKREGDEQLQMEQRRLQNANRVQSYFRVQEEERIPYPTLFQPEKKLQKVAMDLNEAIRGVKANAKKKFLETVEAHVNLGVDPRRGDQLRFVSEWLHEMETCLRRYWLKMLFEAWFAGTVA